MNTDSFSTEFLEGFVEECIQHDIPEEFLEPLFKQALWQNYFQEKDSDFIQGFKETLVKQSSLTEIEADQLIEKMAARPGETAKKPVQAKARLSTPLGETVKKPVQAKARPSTSPVSIRPLSIDQAFKRWTASSADILKALGPVLYKHRAPILTLGSLAALLSYPSWQRGILSRLREKFLFLDPAEAAEAAERAGGIPALREWQDLIRKGKGDITTIWKKPEVLHEAMRRAMAAETSGVRERLMKQRVRQQQGLTDLGLPATGGFYNPYFGWGGWGGWGGF